MVILSSVAVPDVSEVTIVSTVVSVLTCGGTVASSCAVQTNTSRHNKYTSAPFFMNLMGQNQKITINNYCARMWKTFEALIKFKPGR
jgi:hypothetical protein